MTGDVLDIRGQESVTFRLNGREFAHSLVCPLPTKAAGLLGTDHLDRLGAIVDIECDELSLTGVDKILRVCNIPVKRHAALTVFPEGKAGRNPQPTKQEARRMDEQLPASTCSEATPSTENVWLVKAVENVTVPPRCQQIIVGRLDSDEKQNPPPLVCIEPAKIPIEGILPYRELSRVKTKANEPPRVTSSHSSNMARKRNSQAIVMVEEITEELVARFNTRDYTISDPLSYKERKKRNESLYRKLLHGKLDHLPVKERQLIEPVLLKYAHLFHDE